MNLLKYRANIVEFLTDRITGVPGSLSTAVSNVRLIKRFVRSHLTRVERFTRRARFLIRFRESSTVIRFSTNSP